MIEACFTGRLGRNAELRHVKNGPLPMLAFSAAVQDGQAAPTRRPSGSASWCFGDEAEALSARLLRGTRVYVEGRLTAELWQPDDGRQLHVNLNVVASVVQPLGQIGRRRPRQARSQSTRSTSRELPATIGSRRDRDQYTDRHAAPT